MISGEQFGEHVREHGLNAQPERQPRREAFSDTDARATLTSLGALREREGESGVMESDMNSKWRVQPAHRERMAIDELNEKMSEPFGKQPLEHWHSMALAVDKTGLDRATGQVASGDIQGARETLENRVLMQQKLGHEAIMAPSIAGTIPSQRTW